MVAAETVKLRAQVKRLKAKNDALCKALDRSKVRIVKLGNSVIEGRKREESLAEILRAISRSRTDAQPVFDAIADAALRLIGNVSAAVTRLDGDMLHLAALTSTSKRGDERLKALFPCPVSKLPAHARAIRLRVPYCVSDTEKSRALRDMARARGYRSAIFVPLLHGKTAIGTIGVSRHEPGPFSDHEIELLKTFAHQAVIAIENVRLFRELQARNVELTETLEQQRATSEILQVISSSPTDTQPVFDAIVRTTRRLLGDSIVFLRLVTGDCTETVASTLPLDETGGTNPIPLVENIPASQTILRKEIVHIPDAYAEEWAGTRLRRVAEQRGFRAIMHAPMIREGTAIGSIAVSRATPGPFTERQVSLLKTFASQAVIAIENVRLFKELQARNAELTESLEQQSATSEILRIISRNLTDTQPVFDAIVNSGVHLFGGMGMWLRLANGGLSRAGCKHGSVKSKCEPRAASHTNHRRFPGAVESILKPGAGAGSRRSCGRGGKSRTATGKTA